VNSYYLYRASFYLMLTVATAALSGDVGESRFFSLYPAFVAIAGFIAFFTVDRQPRYALSRPLANVLALLTIALLYYEYRMDDSQLIRALGHWLVYLQLIKYALPKTAEDDWFLFLLGLMQVLIGAVVSQSDRIGLWLFAWAMLAIWVLGQFFLQREAGRLQPARDPSAPALLGTGAVDPYAGLLDFPYVMSTIRVLATTLALGGLIFLTLPRQAGATRNQPGNQSAQHLTGFDEEVTLGQFGEILENDTVVMTIEFTDLAGKTVPPRGEPLWRGVTMIHYKQGRWRRQPRYSSQMYVGFPGGKLSPALIRQKIKLEANDSPTLFAIRPVRSIEPVEVGTRVPTPILNPIDGTLQRPDNRVGAYDYIVLSDPDPNGIQLGENPPDLAHSDYLLAISESLKARLRPIAQSVVESITDAGPLGIRARAEALERFLRDSGQFHYTLQMDQIDRDLDPVEDFLVNRKKGHCEYFASALALLLRSIDIPSRMVNGFKGGDWNDITQTLNVRQKHAHSWVEAYIGMGEQNRPIWITLDPTPGEQRDQSVAKVGGIAGSFRPLTDLVRHIWIFYVVGYDGERQSRLLYSPMRQMSNWVKEKYLEMGRLAQRGFARLFRFENIGAFISIRGFVVAFLTGCLLVGVGKLSIGLGRWILRWFRGPGDESTSLTAGILFYRRLTLLLSQLELERSPAETQGEFASRASRLLAGRGQTEHSVAEVPQQVVEAFYRVRFGHLELEPASLDELDARLDALEASLSTGR
jgi:transglutaminase-like putative cysteine protease